MNEMRPSAAPRAAGEDHRDDAWVPSACAMCYGNCSILAHRVGGVIIKIEGNPESATGKGRLCGKGVSGIQGHYDPNRLTKPLRRTNPEKGIGVDPGFVEISWDEALDEIAGQMKRVRDEDPRKLLIQMTTTLTAAHSPLQTFAAGFGTPNMSAAGGGLHCGNGTHLISGMMHASWGIVPDFQQCNYSIFFGASKGHSAGHASASNMKMAADARDRGMKMVVVDPMCNFAAANATEWVPIRVGTDAALALAMANLLVNQLGAVDMPYLKASTNGPYLIGPDQGYVRDPGSGEPLVWDEAAGQARPYAEALSENMALEGSFEVGGVRCRPSFELLKAHLTKFTPEYAAKITTVPVATIRRLAEEFAAEARIGATIVLDGVTLPYRPAAAIAFRGATGHLNSVYNFLAVDLLNQIVGAADVVGGCMGFNPVCHGYPATGQPRYAPSPGPDGLMVAGSWMNHQLSYPIPEPRAPANIGLKELFVMARVSPFLHSSDSEEMWQRFGIDYRPEVLLNFGCNLPMSLANKDVVADTLVKYKFIACIELYQTEMTDFADIVLPDCDYLQSHDSRSNYPFIFSLPAGMGEWCWAIRQPVVAPQGEQRPFAEVMLDLAERIGILEDVNMAYNASHKLEPPYRLEPGKAYSYTEICDRDLKNHFGEEKGLEWFKEHGVLKWPKKPEEVYWRPFTDVRVPIYWEWLPALHQKASAIAAPLGLEIPPEFYQPMPDFLPCNSHKCEGEGFDFFAFYYRDIVHTNSMTMENAWLDEAAQMDPFSYNIAINAASARANGITEGALIQVESETGRRIEGRARLTEAIHPEGLGIAALAGHWAKGLPVAKGKGIFFNELLEIDWRHASPLNLNLDICVKVKVTPAPDS